MADGAFESTVSVCYAQRASGLLEIGDRICGHEFHYYESGIVGTP